MKRLVCTMFFNDLVFSDQACGMPDSGNHKHLDWLKAIGGRAGALAVAPNGCWQTSSFAKVKGSAGAKHKGQKVISMVLARADFLAIRSNFSGDDVSDAYTQIAVPSVWAD